MCAIEQYTLHRLTTGTGEVALTMQQRQRQRALRMGGTRAQEARRRPVAVVRATRGLGAAIRGASSQGRLHPSKPHLPRAHRCDLFSHPFHLHLGLHSLSIDLCRSAADSFLGLELRSHRFVCLSWSIWAKSQTMGTEKVGHTLQDLRQAFVKP